MYSSTAADVTGDEKNEDPSSHRLSAAVYMPFQSKISDQAGSLHKAEVEATDGTRVSRTLVNFWLDAALMLMFVGYAIISAIVQFVFPPGVAAKGWLLWGMNYGQWCGLQFGVLSTLGFAILVHVMLHWTWVCSVISKKLLRLKELPDDGIRTVYGVGLLIILLVTSATIVGIAIMTIQMPPQ